MTDHPLKTINPEAGWLIDAWVKQVPMPLAMRDSPTVPIRKIVRFICEQFEVSQVELCSKRRLAKLAHARHIGYWLCRELTLASYPQIGRAFGNRDHSTILYGCRKVDASIKAQTGLGIQAEFLKTALEGFEQ